MAYWAVRLLLTFEPPLPPGILIDLDLGLDWRVVGFALGVSLVTGILFSLAPALHATGGQLVAALKDASAAGAPARTRLRSVMVAGQMAVTVTLLIVAGLFLRALTTLETLDPGWDAEGVHVLDMDLELSGYEPERGLQFYAELTERVRQIPGIESSAIAAKLPLGGRSSFGDVNVRDVPAPEGRFGHEAYLNRVSPGYFETMGLVLKQGRDVQDTDTATSPMVAVINEAMARRLWPAGDAVGQGFWLGTVGDGQRIEVIGVVENAKYRRLVEDTPNFYYIPYQQRYNAQMTLHFRAGGAPERAIAEVRRAVRELDAGLPVLSFRNLAAALDMFFLPQRLAAWVAASMGVLGLLLAAVGVYGISAYNVAQRRREIGVRIALGATPLDVVRLTLRRGLVAPLVGMSLGLALAFVITRLMLGFLAGISPLDPLTFGSVVFGLLAVAGSAVLLATRRATRLDPVATLRAE